MQLYCDSRLYGPAGRRSGASKRSINCRASGGVSNRRFCSGATWRRTWRRACGPQRTSPRRPCRRGRRASGMYQGRRFDDRDADLPRFAVAEPETAPFIDCRPIARPPSAPRSTRGALRCRRRAAPLPCRPCTGTDAGGAIGREALDASAVASGASIKPGTRPRDPRCPARGERRQHHARREALPP
jgi:hypothetical protein